MTLLISLIAVHVLALHVYGYLIHTVFPCQAINYDHSIQISIVYQKVHYNDDRLCCKARINNDRSCASNNTAVYWWSETSIDCGSHRLQVYPYGESSDVRNAIYNREGRCRFWLQDYMCHATFNNIDILVIQIYPNVIKMLFFSILVI